MRILRAVEPFAVFASVMAYIWIWRAHHPYWWIGILAVMLVSHALRGEGPRQLGFGRASLRECAHRFAPVLLILSLLLVAAALLLHSTRDIPRDRAFLALLAYLPWGLVQQYVLNGYFLNRCDAVFARPAAAAITAVLFAAAHTPNLFLMAVTLAGGWCAIEVYRRHRNLYFLGVAHATVGFLLFVTVPDSVSHHLRIGPGMLQQRGPRAIQ